MSGLMSGQIKLKLKKFKCNYSKIYEVLLRPRKCLTNVWFCVKVVCVISGESSANLNEVGACNVRKKYIYG